MTVAELRAKLAGLPDDLEVVVRTENEDGSGYIGTPYSAALEVGCDDCEFFAVDCEPEWDEEDGPGGTEVPS